jgi:hypothetical protein
MPTPEHGRSSAQLGKELDGIRVLRPSGVGRPRTRPKHLIADKGYSFPSYCELLGRRGIPHTIPQRPDQRERGARIAARSPNLDAKPTPLEI